MIFRLLAIAFIFTGASIAWAILGGTIVARTNSSDERLRNRVQSVWGVPQTQQAPLAEYFVQKPDPKAPPERHTVTASASDLAVGLNLEYRQKGLQWYSTYKVDFRGDYEFRNPDTLARELRLNLRFPAAQAVYDGLEFLVNGRPATPAVGPDGAYVIVNVAPLEKVQWRVSYKSQGLDAWRYRFGERVNPVENFRMRMTTDFKDIDFPDNTLAPTVKQATGSGWRLDWTYTNLLSGYDIAMAMPAKLQPGALASQISFFAPVSLFFFLFVMLVLTTTRDIEIHPMNYFFLAAAFFAFHLLLAYLVDHLDIYVSFAIASAVSVLLVVSYLRIVVGAQFALREAALAQFIYLVLFSFAFFFKGFTGLTVTIGSILTLFVAMQMTGKIRWAEKFRATTPPPLPSPSR